ncbi:hypothetical protein FSW04_02780 [Baekduia soli]|uniref:Uncharacterized protein n=1 Tax=Baekduia soli TaxID=496014 RepID=A0A5B8U0S1_9ACTN|nr:hypothetical protein [Baekduia soli]QEC46609.1 hypothetical protein FSW04_02780 [Baekduia soli]
MTPEVRHRAAFELLRFTAAPVSADLAVVELDGRFAAPAGRFTRRPVLVVEHDDAPRLELAPVRAAEQDGRWHSSYAVPVTALRDGRFALGVRGTLLDLPLPDVVEGGDRAAAIAREANRLRRRIEELEDEAAAARADAEAARAGLDAAVDQAREAERTAAAEQAGEAARAAEARRQEAEAAGDARVAEVQARLEAEAARTREALDRAQAAEDRARTEAEGVEVLRAELAEERRRSQETIAELRAAAPPAGDPEPTLALDALAAPAGDEPTTAAPADDATQRLRLEPVARAAGGLADAAVPDPPRHHAKGPSLSPWFAVGALVLFAFLVLGLLLGFLG